VSRKDRVYHLHGITLDGLRPVEVARNVTTGA
jgi:hypothetical protein